ncbi:MAG: PAS domain S-box protein [Bacteroidia bacterium]
MPNEKHSPNINQDSSENMLIEISADGFCSKVNLATCSLTGFELDEIVGKKFKDFVDLEEFKLKEIETAISTGNGFVVNFEGNFRKKNGQKLFILWSAYWSIRNKSLVCIGKDLSITEQKLIKANKELNLLNRINDLLRTGIEGKDLLDLVCNTIIDEGKYHLAWFGLFSQEDGEFTQLKPLCKAGLSKLVDDLNLDFKFNSQPFDPFIESLKVKIPLHENYKKEFPNISNNSLVLKKAGISNAIFIPVNFGTIGYGILNICSINDKPFDSHEIQILERIAENISLNLRYNASEQLNSNNNWKIGKINSELELLNEVNNIILREKDEEKLLNETFQLILTRSKYKLIWLSSFKKEELLNLEMIPQKIWGETAYADSLVIDFKNPLALKGPTATTALTGKTSVVNSTQSNPEYILWRERTALFGIKSSISLSLNFNAPQQCVVCIYSDIENAFDAHEIEILERIIRNLSYAINSINESKIKQEFGISLEFSNKQLMDYKFALDKSALVSSTDINGAILYVNDNFLNFSGYTSDELIGNTHQMINSKFHPRSFWTNLWDTILSGNIWSGEIKNIKKNGEFIWLDTTIIPLKDEHENIVQFLAIRYDITGTKKLSERNQYISFLVDSTQDSIIGLNRNGQITSWNRGAEKIYGYTSIEAENKQLFELLPTVNKNEEQSYISKLHSNSKLNETFELWRIKKDGKTVPLLITLSSIEDEEGKIIGISEIARDISGIKESELELQKQIEFLKELSFINSFEIKQEISKLKSLAFFVQDKLNDSKELDEVFIQANRSFTKLNQSLDKLNNMIVLPLEKNSLKLPENIQLSIERVCIIDEDLNQSATIKAELLKVFKEDSLMFFTEIDSALKQMKKKKMDETCLIILDTKTDKGRAWDFLKQHELLRFKSRVILMSDEIPENSIERAKDYKCVGNYVSKPFREKMAQDIVGGNILIWNND